MKLKSFRVTEFRSVWDSGLIKTGDVTCLVGKNEAGKTALLKALYRLNPIINEDAKFDVTDDYPRKDVEDYKHAVETGDRRPATVTSAEFELEDEDVKPIAEIFGVEALAKRNLKLEIGYNNQLTFSLAIDEDKARQHLASASGLTDELRGALQGTATWKSFGETLAAAEKTAEVKRLIELTDKFKTRDASYHIYNTALAPRVPKLLYFDEYYQLEGRENVQQLIQRRDAKALKRSDYPLLGLINIARLKLNELVNVQRTTELTNTLEGASNHLTRQVLKYWSQNRHLQLKFDVREAKPQDPPDMRTGVNIWGRVYDQVHWATTELGTRSRGFVWFFSFLAWYEDVKRSNQNVILLLDEPGLSLPVRHQNIWRRLGLRLAECGPHHWVDVKRRACGAASGDIRWSVV